MQDSLTRGLERVRCRINYEIGLSDGCLYTIEDNAASRGEGTMPSQRDNGSEGGELKLQINWGSVLGKDC